MYKIKPIISLWCAVFLLAAVVCAQLDVRNSFYSGEINHHGRHIDSADPTDNVFVETKQINFVPGHFDFIPFFKLPFVVFSGSQFAFQHPPVLKSVSSTEFCGRAPPA